MITLRPMHKLPHKTHLLKRSIKKKIPQNPIQSTSVESKHHLRVKRACIYLFVETIWDCCPSCVWRGEFSLSENCLHVSFTTEQLKEVNILKAKRFDGVFSRRK